ncbi:hypothetical protein KEM56_002494 [Ascosphaera pollenicola]|nr:hypothetical protein KEM56_002494 [Ascosphaera pollenicola]
MSNLTSLQSVPSTVRTALISTTAVPPTTNSALAAAPSSSFYPSAENGTVSALNGDTGGECRLLGSFSIVIQAVLGGLALLALVYKRWRERPQRPIKVWAFDVSKQVFGSTMLHVANLLASLFSAGRLPVSEVEKPNPCSYYLLNLGIDTTFGILFLWLVLKFLNWAAYYTPLANPPESIESGYYGQPPRTWWWFKQSIIYFFGLVIMKTCVVTLIHFVPIIVTFGDWALRWTEGNTAVQIFFVMLLFPVCMNALQYYIIDTFIKRNTPLTDDDEDAYLGDTETPSENGQLYASQPDRQSHNPLLSDMDGYDELSEASDSTLPLHDHSIKRRSVSTQRELLIGGPSSLRRGA